MKRSLIDKQFKGNVLFSYGTQLFVVGVGFISTTLITHYAGIATYGMIATMTALSGILANLMTFRTNEAVINFYKQGEVKNIPGLCRLALLAGLSLDMVMGGLLFLLVQLFSPIIAASLLKQSDLQADVALFSSIMLAKFLRGTPLGLLVAEERFRLINSLNLVEQLFKALLLSVMVFSGISLTFANIIWSMLIPSVLVTCTVYVFPLIKLAGSLRGVPLPRDRWRDYGHFTLSTFLSSTLKAANQNIDTIILGYFTNPANVGIYSLFGQFLSPIAMLAVPFTNQITPLFVKAVVENRLEDIRLAINHANRLLMKGFILMLLLISPIIYIYGNLNKLNFTLEHYVVFIVMIISAFFIQQLWWGRQFSIAVDARISLLANAISVCLTIVCVTVFTQLFGLIGCSIGMLINYMGVLVFYKLIIRNYI